MLAKLALLFLVIMAAIVLIFGRPRAGDGAGRRRLFGRRPRPPDRRD
ncbi:hypothetical protein [Albimonas pacifica]|uniref:Uncharacterized protein n=1 Tax=Albimonas pacifica TaxID=1114924 RepID=A0A1I3F568_9RHOB|nr:hypothetical protein [Albimonas pacifica]SFI05931.1 hypothetical protein SAMN05216258_10453 [Albimonas pacifica]